jgi:hypothetical protein
MENHPHGFTKNDTQPDGFVGLDPSGRRKTQRVFPTSWRAGLFIKDSINQKHYHNTLLIQREKLPASSEKRKEKWWKIP